MQLNEDLLKSAAMVNLSKAKKELGNAVTTIQKIKIPTAMASVLFPLTNKISESIPLLNTIKKECDSIESWLESVINKFNFAERQNQEILAQLGFESIDDLLSYESGDLKNICDEQSEIQARIWYELISAGFSEIQAAAIMGNLEYESGGLLSDSVEDGSDEYNGGIGLAQWTNFKGNGRNTFLRNFAASRGADWRDLDIQIEYLISELTQTGEATNYMDFINYPPFTDSSKEYQGLPYSSLASREGFLNNSNTLQQATASFLYSFESPTFENAQASYTDRYQLAIKYFNTYTSSSEEEHNLQACEQITSELLARNATYNRDEYGSTLYAASNYNSVVCVTYVCLYLQLTNQLPTDTINSYDINNINDHGSSKGLITMLTENGWQTIEKSDISSGDIIIKQGDGQNGHAVVYVKENVIYDQKSGVISSQGEPPIRTCVSSEDYTTYMTDPSYIVYRSPNKPTLDNQNSNFEPYITKVTLESEELNVREEPNISSTVVSTLPNGSTVQINKEDSGWGLVNDSEQPGWINLSYTEKQSEDDN